MSKTYSSGKDASRKWVKFHFAAYHLKAFFVTLVSEAEMANNRPVLLGRSIRRL